MQKLGLLPEDVGAFRKERNHASAGFAFGRVEVETLSGAVGKCVAHAYGFLFVVDVFPLQAENLSDTEACQNGETVYVPITRGFGAADEFGELRLAEGGLPEQSCPAGRHVNQIHGIYAYDLMLAGGCEEVTEHGTHGVDAGGGETLLADPVEAILKEFGSDLPQAHRAEILLNMAGIHLPVFDPGAFLDGGLKGFEPDVKPFIHGMAGFLSVDSVFHPVPRVEKALLGI